MREHAWTAEQDREAAAADASLPTWVQQARRGLGQKMKEYVMADIEWDTYTCAQVVRGHVQGAASPFLPRMRALASEEEAQRVLGSVLEAATL